MSLQHISKHPDFNVGTIPSKIVLYLAERDGEPTVLNSNSNRIRFNNLCDRYCSIDYEPTLCTIKDGGYYICLEDLTLGMMTGLVKALIR